MDEIYPTLSNTGTSPAFNDENAFCNIGGSADAENSASIPGKPSAFFEGIVQYDILTAAAGIEFNNCLV